jgi:hypothetical protein
MLGSSSGPLIDAPWTGWAVALVVATAAAGVLLDVRR